MASQTPNFSSPVDGELLGKAIQRLINQPALLNPQAEAGGAACFTSNSENQVEALSDEEGSMMAQVNNLAIDNLALANPFDIQTCVHTMSCVWDKVNVHYETDSDMVNSTELRVRRLLAQADIAEENFGRLGNAECIHEVVECRAQALSLTSYGHVDRGYRLATLGVSLHQKFECLGNLVDINKAIQCLSQATLLTLDGHADKPAVLNNLGNSYESRFVRLGDLADIDKAIESKSQAVLLTPDGHSDKPARLSNLGISYQSRFECLGELSDIDKAVECKSQAVMLIPDGHADKPAILNNLGTSHVCRFKRIGEVTDVDKAIECLSQALLLTPDGHAGKPARLSNLGSSYESRFGRLGELSDINKAIDCGIQAVMLTPNGHAEKPVRLSNLGISYESRFERLGEIADLNKAIGCKTQALLLTPDGHAERSTRLNNLGSSYACRFERLGELEDIDKAITCMSQSLLLTPNSHADKSARFSNLGNSYMRRFERLGELADIDKSIECARQAVLLIPDGHADKPAILNQLGISHQSRFERLGELADLNEAIEDGSQAVQLTPDGHTDKPARLNNLGISYARRFQRLGEIADMDKAIECQRQAALLTPDDHADKPATLSNLGASYHSRFERLDELGDINKAIDCGTQATMLTPDGHTGKPDRLSNLGVSYQSRFGRLGELVDIDKAINCAIQAVMLTSDGHAGKPALLSNLGVSYQSRFGRFGDLADINQAIDCLSQAVLLTPDGHAQKPAWLNNLGNSYQSRFKRLEELADLDKAIEYHGQALLLTPDGHADRPLRLINLGNSHMHRFERLGALADVEHAQSCFQRGAELHAFHPGPQITCACKWAKTSFLLALSPQSAYERCMELLPHLIWVGATIDQRYTQLTSISDIATEAAAWAISVQSYDIAIEWLEAGRSILWSQLLQLRKPFDDLSAADPFLARRLKNIAVQLDRAGSRQAPEALFTDATSDLETEAQYHRRLASEWEQHLEEARKLPGFHNYMRPRKLAELRLAATDGPVIIINVHRTRCDALIILPDCEDVVHVPLENIALAKLVDACETLGSIVGHRGERARGLKLSRPIPKSENTFKPMLATLWSGLVSPILDALAYVREMPVNELPHVTWCTTGALSFLPLHAAGRYEDTLPNTFDLIVSSYTPTLSALLALSGSAPNADCGLMAVGQERTPGLSPLPNTVQELAAVKEHTKVTRFQQLDGANATVDAVLDAMEEHNWVHLACHATQNTAHPAQSAFHLWDGPLSLKTITNKMFKNKCLAFLSACQTATGDDRLPEESVHLAAGMLMAGYPSVIATMWAIYDDDAPGVAGEVYAELLKEGKMDHRWSARALHKAVASLREKVGNDAFMRWVPFIHIGV